MGVGIHDDGLDLCGDGSLWLGTEARSTGEVGVSIRIGITREAHRPLRFYETGSRFVSGPGRLNRVLPLNPEPKNSTQRRKDAKEN
jgi:DNA-3-methyladenine glycosylase